MREACATSPNVDYGQYLPKAQTRSNRQHVSDLPAPDASGLAQAFRRRSNVAHVQYSPKAPDASKYELCFVFASRPASPNCALWIFYMASIAQNATQSAPEPEGYLVTKEVAARLRRQPRTIQRWMKQGLLPYIKVGTSRRSAVLFRWPDVCAALQARFGEGAK